MNSQDIIDLLPTMPEFGTLPAAVYTAIAIFCIKEGIEYRRRRNTDVIKMRVYKRVVASECRVLARYADLLTKICLSVRPDVDGFKVITEASGRLRIDIAGYNGIPEVEYTFYIPKVTTTTLEKMVIDVGYIDSQFSEEVSGVLDTALHMIRNREGIIDHAALSATADNNKRIEMFWGLTRSSIDRWQESLNKILEACGPEYEKFTVKSVLSDRSS